MSFLPRNEGSTNLKFNRANAWDRFRISSLFALIGGLGACCISVALVFDGTIEEFMGVLFRGFLYESIPRKALQEPNAYRQWLQTWESCSYLRGILPWFWMISTFLSGVLAHIQIGGIGSKEAQGHNLREGEPKLVSPKELIKEIKKRVKRSAKETLTEAVIYISNSRVPITAAMMNRNMEIPGANGVGKTTLIDQMLVQAISNEEKCLIFDLNGSFYQKHGREGDIILSLYDKRAAPWSPFMEGDLSIIAEGLVPPRSDEGAESRYWQEAGRDVCLGVLRQAKSLEELAKICQYSVAELRDFLRDRNDNSSGRLGQSQDSKMAEGVVSVALSTLRRFLPSLNTHAKARQEATGKMEPYFSLRDWVRSSGDKRNVYLVSTDAHLAETIPLITLCTSIVAKTILELPEGGPSRGCIVIDELGSMGYISSLLSLAQRSRKYNWKLILAFQSPSQIENVYGKHQARDLLNNLTSKVYFRVNEPSAAQMMSETLATEEKEFPKTSRNLSEKGGPTLGTEIKTRPLVTPSQLLNLPDRTAYVKLAMCTSVTKLEWDYVQYPLKHQSSEKESEKMDKPYLGSLPNLPYVSLFDTERRDFSLKTKGLVEELLNAFHASATSAFSEERLEDAALNCVKFLSGAKSLTDRCEGRIYEIFLNGKKLSVRRDAVQIELDLGASPFSKSSDEEDLG